MMLVEQCRFRGRGSIRTKFVEPETYSARTGPFRETGVHVGQLIPLLAADHVRVCGTLITVNHAPGAPERFFEPRKSHCFALRWAVMPSDHHPPGYKYSIRYAGRFPRPGSATRRHLLDFVIQRQVQRAMGPGAPVGPSLSRSAMAAGRCDTGVCQSRGQGGSYPTARPSRTPAPGRP